MESTRLNIQLTTLPNCKLIAEDQTVYEENENLFEHVFVDFMCYQAYSDDIENLTPIQNSIRIVYIQNLGDYTTDKFLYTYTFQKDGTYIYYKYGMPTLNHPGIYYDGIYHIKDVVFYYNARFYIGLEDTSSLSAITSLEVATAIDNYYDFRTYANSSIDYNYDEKVFTYCKINQCLIKYQRELIFDNIKQCGYSDCTKNSQLKMTRDFLFDTVYVLNYLMHIGSLLEAQKLIENLSFCTGVCNGDLSTSKNCGCGQTI